MNDHQLRVILLNLHSRLSDNDRERLHFYLQNDVPRPLVDDSSLSGTLRLMQSLFDQDKINENDYTFLINAFEQIRCFDAVHLLKDHQRRMRLDGCIQSTQSLVSMMPPVIDELLGDCQDDKYPTDRLTLPEFCNDNDNNQHGNKNDIISGNNISLHSININQDTKTILTSEKKRPGTCLLTKKCLLLPYILFLLVLVVLIVVVIAGMKHIHSLQDNLRKKEDLIASIQDENNQSTTELARLLLEKNVAIEMLNRTLIELQNGSKTALIKAGQRFGGDGGAYFDDSSSLLFTHTHHLSGITLSTSGELDSCQFIYSSPCQNQSDIESDIHGLNGVRINSTSTYYLDHDERIKKVSVKSYNITFVSPDESRYSTKVVRRLQFTTTNGQRIPPGIALEDNTVQSESFPGYTLGYATGKAGLRIDQLQFYWYRTVN